MSTIGGVSSACCKTLTLLVSDFTPLSPSSGVMCSLILSPGSQDHYAAACALACSLSLACYSRGLYGAKNQ